MDWILQMLVDVAANDDCNGALQCACCKQFCAWQGQSAPESCCSWPQGHAALPAGHAEQAQLAVVTQKTADQALHSPQICSHGSQTGAADAHHQLVCPEGCVMKGN